MAALKSEPLKREFVDSKTNMTLPDPNKAYTPEQVKDYYGNQYPHLINATLSGPDMGGGKLTFTFSSKAGTKG
jgi:PRTRC genetic system protein C